jgi:hypothetical protein
MIRSVAFALLLAVTALLATPTLAFVVTPTRTSAGTVSSTTSSTARSIFNKNKKQQDDFSDIESRDMTRKEMLELNQQNEDIMNAELIGMTGFSLVVSIPMLYLVWVAFFAETVDFGEL